MRDLGAPMNRKQRRAAEKKVGVADRVRNTPLKPVLPLAPLTIAALKNKYPDITNAIDKFEVDCKLDAANEIFNLVFSSVLISLHDKFDFNAEQLNNLVSYAVNHIDCVKSGFVTKGDLMLLAEELGVQVAHLDYSQIDHTAQQTHDRLKIYFEERENMSRQEQAFDLFDKGVTDCNIVAAELGVKISTAYTYKWAYKQRQLENMTPDEFADEIFEEEVTDITATQETEELKEATAEIQEGEEKLQEVEEKIQEEVKVVDEKKVLDIPAKARKFEVKRTVDITAEFGTYSITGAVVDVKLDTAEMGLTKADLLAFAEELQAVAGEM